MSTVGSLRWDGGGVSESDFKVGSSWGILSDFSILNSISLEEQI